MPPIITLHRVLRLMLAFVCVCLASSASADSSGKLRFVFFSDSQDPFWGDWMNTNILAEIAQAVTNDQPAFVLFGGDLANRSQIEAPPVWTNIMTPVYSAGIPVYPVLGNHDIYEVAAFVETHKGIIPQNGPPGEVGRTYSITRSNVLVLALDAFAGPGAYMVNQAWVDAVLGTNTASHVFAFSHPPAFKFFHRDCLGSWPERRNAFWRSLVQAGCRAYFCGHDHRFDHTQVTDGDANPNNDVHQFISGTGGSAFYPDDVYDGDNGPWTPVRVFDEANYGYLLVEIDGDQARVVWKHRVEAGVFEASSDVFTYTAVPRLFYETTAGKLLLTWKGEAKLQAASAPGGPFADLVGATSPYPATNLVQTRLFFRLVH